MRSSTTMMLIVFVLLMAGLGSVSTQPLDQPAVPFNCGNIRCQRQGFYACVGADEGEPACYSCKLKRGTCGTTKEFPGCNLYCEDQLIKRYERIVQGYNGTNLDQSLQIDQLSNQIKILKQTILDQKVTNVQLTERSERLNSTINDQNVTNVQLTEKNNRLNSTINVQQVEIKKLRQENGGLNNTIQVQQVEIQKLRQENGGLNNTIQVEHANIEEFKSDGVTCSKRDFACLFDNWPVLKAVVFAPPCGVVFVAVVILVIIWYRTRKHIPLKDKRVDKDAKKPLTGKKSRLSNNSVNSMELGDMASSKDSFSSSETAAIYDDMPNKGSRSPSNTSGHSDCYCEKKLKPISPVDDKGDGQYQLTRQ